MTKTIGLSAYLLQMRKMRTKDWEVMSHGGEMDGWAYLSEYFNSRLNELVNLQSIVPAEKSAAVSRVFKVIDVHAHKKEGVFCGLVEAGNFGRAGKIVNKDTDKIVHQKKLNEADMSPFYFRIEVPDGDTRALLVVQRSGLSGFKSAFEADLKRFFHDKDITIGTDLLTDRDILDTYLTRGELTDVVVVAHKAADDPRDAMRESRIDGEPIKPGTRLAVSISSRKTLVGKLKTALAVARRRKPVSELVSVKGLENPEEVTVRVEAGGKSRSFSILHPDEAGISYDITNDVSYNAENHPRFDSIDGLARKWCQDLRRQLA